TLIQRRRKHMTRCQLFDVAIIGGGIAGLSVALRLPEHMHVALITKGQLGESNTRYAQGGLAVALGMDDSPELHYEDTLAAGQDLTLHSHAVVLASGGAGGLWLHTSNPSRATADGVYLAWRARAALSDLEFIQFDPSVLVAGNTSHMISEAVSGEGAYLRNH